MACDSGAGEESPAPALLRTPSMLLNMVSPAARVPSRARVAGLWGRTKTLGASSRESKIWRNRSPAWSAAGERVFISVRREAVFGMSHEYYSGARIQRRAGLVVAARPPSVPRCKLVQPPEHCSGCSCSEPGTRRRCGNLVVFLLQ